MSSKDLFISLVKDIKRDGIDELLDYLEKSSFYSDPASSSYHSNYPGGLVDHSIKVYKILQALCKVNKIDVGEDTIKIVSLFHDFVKIGSYDIGLKNIKNERTNNKWQSCMFYQNKCNNQVLAHGLQSACWLSDFLELTEEEFSAITYHMGGYGIHPSDEKTYKNAIAKYPVILLLNHADTQAAFLHEPQYDILDIPWIDSDLLK